MGVDVVVVSFNTRDLLRECLQSVRDANSEVPGTRAFVTDNDSRDGSPEMVRSEFPEAELIALSENIGFGPGNNRGMAAGNSELVLFLNSDAKLTPGALRTMVDYLDAHADCVAVGPRLIYPDGCFQRSCRRFPTVWRNFWSMSGLDGRLRNRLRRFRSWLEEDEHVSGRRVDMVSGACFLARRAYMDSVGGFDENLFMYEEEPDVFLPTRRNGGEVRYCGEAVVVHGSGASVKQNRMSEFACYHRYRSKYYCFAKHYGRLRARLAWLTDAGILGFSTYSNRLRRKASDAGMHFNLCRKAYRELGKTKTTRNLTGLTG
jgi:GT2 family glycosyltransferase